MKEEWKFYSRDGYLVIATNEYGHSVTVTGLLYERNTGNKATDCINAGYDEIPFEQAIKIVNNDFRENFLSNLTKLGIDYKKDKSPNDYWWFAGRERKGWDFNLPIVCIDKKTNLGVNFCKSGENFSGSFHNGWNKENTLRYCEEISFKKAMTYLTPNGAKRICEFLNVSADKNKNGVSKKRIKELAQILFDNKAFNGDCAFTVDYKDWEVFDKMEKRGVVNKSPLDSNMYYLTNDWENKLKDYKVTKNKEVKTDKKWRAWKEEEVPIGAYIRSKYGGNHNLGDIIRKVKDGIIYDSSFLDINNHYSLLTAFERFEYSDDGGKTYSRCGVFD